MLATRRARENTLCATFFTTLFASDEKNYLTMPFLNPRADFAFKRIFGSESDTSKLISLLNAVLQVEGDKRITDIELLNPYNAPKIPLLKDSYLDIRARDASGKYYLIEMQVANVEGMQKRVLYNACKQYGNQLDKGDDYLLLNDVIAITFTNFVLFDYKADLRSSFVLRDADGNIYGDDLELIFIELPKFNIGKEELQQLTSDLDKWLYFLKYADDLDTRPPEFDQDQTLRSAFDAANYANLNKHELQLYDDNLKLIRDRRGSIAYALNKGLRTGIHTGLRRGALALARQGLSIADIASELDLPESEVEQMLDQKQPT